MFYCVIRLKEEYDSNYIYHILKNYILPKKEKILTEGSVIQTIRTNYLKEVKIPIINEKEQIKLGKLLELLDTKKDLHKKLINTNEKLQKAIINQEVSL